MTDPPRPAVGDIYRELRRRICLLELQPGERLREEPLAEEFGISRTPVRQALARLEHERLVQHMPGAGATVAIIDSKEIRDVWAVRLKLADLVGDFVRLPAPAITVDALQAVRDDIDAIRSTRELRELGALYDHFHTLLLELYTSQTLRRIQDQLFHLTTRVWLQFLPELDLDHELDVMAEEVDATIVAVQGRSGSDFADVRIDHMRRLLARFNDHVARPLG